MILSLPLLILDDNTSAFCKQLEHQKISHSHGLFSYRNQSKPLPQAQHIKTSVCLQKAQFPPL
jgi:hypothetical protein